MILIDYRTGSKELLPYIQKLGVPCQIEHLEYGDVCFEGHGPKGTMAIGVERKTLHDMMHCIDDARYAAYQRPGMEAMYNKNFLILEGHWKPHYPDVSLMEGFNGGISWGPCRYRSQVTRYSKLYRYLVSIQYAGVIVTYSRDIAHTAVNITELYHYHQKKWIAHRAMQETQKLALPSMHPGKAKLVRRWAADLEDIGVVYSQDAERMFKTPIKLAQADESAWMKIKGIGAGTAQRIIKEIRGW